MLGVIHVTNAPTDPYRPSNAPQGWEVELTQEMGTPLPGDPVRIRRGKFAAVPGRVYAVNLINRKLYVELLEEETDINE